MKCALCDGIGSVIIHVLSECKDYPNMPCPKCGGTGVSGRGQMLPGYRTSLQFSITFDQEGKIIRSGRRK